MTSVDCQLKKAGIDWDSYGAKVKAFVISQFLLLSYIFAATIALAWPYPGKQVASVTVGSGDYTFRLIQTINIIIVFFISGLVLKTDELKEAVKHRLGVIYGFVSVLLITPCLGFGYREIPLTPSAFTAGLTLTCAVPCTLGIGLSLVRSCKGNEALALLLTVGTNIVGIFTMPLWLKALFSGASNLDLTVNIPAMLVKLIITALVPSVAGKVVRDLSKRVQQFTKDHKTFLGLFSTGNLACIVWLVLSGAQEVLMEQKFLWVLYVILLALAQHCIYLIFNFLVVWYVLRMPTLEAIATGIMASQKSGPVAVTVISYITNDVSQQGLMAIPAVINQLGQVFIGSALVPFFSRKAEKYKAEQAALSRAHLLDGPAAAEAGAVGSGGDAAAAVECGNSEKSSKVAEEEVQLELSTASGVSQCHERRRGSVSGAASGEA